MKLAGKINRELTAITGSSGYLYSWFSNVRLCQSGLKYNQVIPIKTKHCTFTCATVSGNVNRIIRNDRFILSENNRPGTILKKSIQKTVPQKKKQREGREGEGRGTKQFFSKKKKNRQQSIYAHRFKAKRDTTMTRFIPQFHTQPVIYLILLPLPLSLFRFFRSQPAYRWQGNF